MSVSDWENEASGHLARFCPHPASRYAFGQARSMLHDTSGQSPQSLMTDLGLKCTGFEFCPEATAKVAKKGYKIPEIPIHYHPRSIEEGKKISWKDGIQAIWTLIKYRI